MGFLDLVSWLVGPSQPTEVEASDEVRSMVEGARSDSLTASLLAESAGRTNVSLFEYLEDGEQPHYVLRGTRLVLVDASDKQDRKHPTGILVVLITDTRVVFVLGGRFGDDVYQVPLADVTSAYVDRDDPKQHIVVEATADGDPMTFFADVSLESFDEVRAGVEYLTAAR